MLMNLSTELQQFPMPGFALSVLLVAALVLWRSRWLLRPQKPDANAAVWGWVAVPSGERWNVCKANGRVEAVMGPAVFFSFGAHMTKLKRICASNLEFIRVQFISGKTDIVQGPSELFVDPLVHNDVKLEQATSLTDHEVLVVYREGAKTQAQHDEAARAVQRHLVHGPCLHVPVNATEWVQEFCWHGSISDDPEKNGRKVKGATKFKKLRTCPEQTYIDVEGVRTRDDALIRVKVMLFYRLHDIETMLRETHDPIADFVNALGSDIVEYVGSRTFEEFKSATDKLNDLSSYQQLTAGANRIGFEITKVVFRGYGAPQQLQRMHDDAIERRTKLALDRESQEQEQQIQDMKLQKDEQRLRVRRQMDSEAKTHELEMQRNAKAHALELQRLTHEASMKEETEKLQLQSDHMTKLKQELGLSAEQLTAYLTSKEQGRPEKLIQIVGGGSHESRASSFVQLQTVA